MHARIEGDSTDRKLLLTLKPPHIPIALEGLDQLTLSTGMTHQLDVDALSSALGKTVTAFSCDFSGKTATDTRFLVSNTGLITVAANVGTAYVYAETDDPATLAVIEVTVTGSPTVITSSQDKIYMVNIADSQTVAVTAWFGTDMVPATFTASSNNPAVCTVEYVSVSDYAYTFRVIPVGFGAASITFKAMKSGRPTLCTMKGRTCTSAIPATLPTSPMPALRTALKRAPRR